MAASISLISDESPLDFLKRVKVARTTEFAARFGFETDVAYRRLAAMASRGSVIRLGLVPADGGVQEYQWRAA